MTIAVNLMLLHSAVVVVSRLEQVLNLIWMEKFHAKMTVKHEDIQMSHKLNKNLLYCRRICSNYEKHGSRTNLEIKNILR